MHMLRQSHRTHEDRIRLRTQQLRKRSHVRLTGTTQRSQFVPICLKGSATGRLEIRGGLADETLIQC